MKTNKILRTDLCETFDLLRAGKITVEEAREIANVAGKILSTVKVEIAYAELTDTKPKIEFLK